MKQYELLVDIGSSETITTTQSGTNSCTIDLSITLSIQEAIDWVDALNDAVSIGVPAELSINSSEGDTAVYPIVFSTTNTVEDLYDWLVTLSGSGFAVSCNFDINGDPTEPFLITWTIGQYGCRAEPFNMSSCVRPVGDVDCGPAIWTSPDVFCICDFVDIPTYKSGLRQLDIDSSFGVSLNFSISDINDISTKNSSYSKTISLPDTANNRDIFGYIFGLNTQTNTFNPQKRTKCWVLKDTLTQMEGNIQLVSITYNKNTNLNQYECVIYADNDTLFKSIGERYLSDLDLSRFDHNWNVTNIINSWSLDYKNGYYYPLIDYGFPLQMTVPLKNENFFPSVYVKTYIDQIFAEAGYTYTSDFFESEFFTNLIIPFSNKNLESTLFNLELDENNNIFDVGLSASFIGSTWLRAGGSDGNFNFNGQDVDVWCPIVCDFEVFNPNGNYNTASGVYTNPPDFGFSQKLKIKVDLLSTISTIENTAPQWSDDFTTTVAADPAGTTFRTESWQDDIYIFAFRSKSPDGSNYNGATFGVSMPVDDWYLYNKDWQIWPGSTTFVNTITFNGKRAYSVRNGNLTVSQTFSGIYRYSGEIETDWVNDNPMRVGEKLIVYVARKARATSNGVAKLRTVSLRINKNTFPPPVFPEPIVYSGFKMQLQASTTTAVGNSFLETKRYCPANVKQKDLLANIMKMFNLYIEPDKVVKNNFIIEPRDDYYNNYERQKDWSDKLDVSKDFNSRIASDTQARTNLFTYKSDRDGMNTNYTNATAQVFGEYKWDIDNDFLSRDRKIEVFFSPTPLNIMAGSNNIFIPTISGSNTTVTKSNGMNIRILYRKKINTTGSDNIVVAGAGLFGLPVTFTYYPYAGFLDDPNNTNMSLNFGQVQLIKDGNYVAGNTPNNVFYTYWQNTILQLSDPNCKIVTANFWLNPNDIEDFRFSDLIFFSFNGNDGYYRVNKIYDYDPSSLTTTKVELIKTNQYQIGTNSIYENQSGFRTPFQDIQLYKNIFEDNAPIVGVFNTAETNVVKSVNNMVAGELNYLNNPSNMVLGDSSSVEGSNNFLSGEGLRITGGNNILVGSYSTIQGSNNVIIGDGNSIVSNEITPNMVLGNRVGGLIEGSFLMGEDISVTQTTQRSFIVGASFSGSSDKSFIFGENISLNASTQSQGATLSNLFLFGNNINIQNPSTQSGLDSIFVIGNNLSLTQSILPNTLYIETDNIITNVIGTSSFNKMVIGDLVLQDLANNSYGRFQLNQYNPADYPGGSYLVFNSPITGLEMVYNDLDGGYLYITRNNQISGSSQLIKLEDDDIRTIINTTSSTVTESILLTNSQIFRSNNQISHKILGEELNLNNITKYIYLSDFYYDYMDFYTYSTLDIDITVRYNSATAVGFDYLSQRSWYNGGGMSVFSLTGSRVSYNNLTSPNDVQSYIDQVSSIIWGGDEPTLVLYANFGFTASFYYEINLKYNSI